MKNKFKLIGLITLAAIIGFSMAACASTPPVPPSTPTGVTMEERIGTGDPLRPRGLVINWTAVEGAERYTVLLREGTRYLPSTNVTTNRATIAVENGGIEYSVQIVAKKGSGRNEAQSAESQRVTIRTTPLTAAETTAKNAAIAQAAAAAEAQRAAQAAAAAEAARAEEARLAAIRNNANYQRLLGSWQGQGQSLTFRNDGNVPVLLFDGNTYNVQTVTANQVTTGDNRAGISFNYTLSGNTLTVTNFTMRAVGIERATPLYNGTYTKR